MKRICIAIVALLSVSSAAFAQYASYPAQTSRRAAIAHAASGRMWTNPADSYVGNANSCGMELSRPVWGPNGGLAGYACYRNSNG